MQSKRRFIASSWTFAHLLGVLAKKPLEQFSTTLHFVRFPSK